VSGANSAAASGTVGGRPLERCRVLEAAAVVALLPAKAATEAEPVRAMLLQFWLSCRTPTRLKSRGRVEIDDGSCKGGAIISVLSA
jgi:hypothetical protein